MQHLTLAKKRIRHKHLGNLVTKPLGCAFKSPKNSTTSHLPVTPLKTNMAMENHIFSIGSITFFQVCSCFPLSCWFLGGCVILPPTPLRAPKPPAQYRWPWVAPNQSSPATGHPQPHNEQAASNRFAKRPIILRANLKVEEVDQETSSDTAMIHRILRNKSLCNPQWSPRYDLIQPPKYQSSHHLNKKGLELAAL